MSEVTTKPSAIGPEKKEWVRLNLAVYFAGGPPPPPPPPPPTREQRIAQRRAQAEAQKQASSATTQAPRTGSGSDDMLGNLLTTGLSFAFKKARLEWAFARSSARDGLERLQTGLRDALKGHPQFPELDAAIGKLDAALVKLDERLEDTLDAAVNSNDPAKQAQCKQDALKIIGEYRTVVENDPMMLKMDANPFMKVTVQSALSAQLAAMAAELAV
jgi:hypothetical protein